ELDSGNFTTQKNPPDHDLHFHGRHQCVNLKKRRSLGRIHFEETKWVGPLAEAPLVFTLELVDLPTDLFQVLIQIASPEVENPGTSGLLQNILQQRGVLGFTHAALRPSRPARKLFSRSRRNRLRSGRILS